MQGRPSTGMRPSPLTAFGEKPGAKDLRMTSPLPKRNEPARDGGKIRDGDGTLSSAEVRSPWALAYSDCLVYLARLAPRRSSALPCSTPSCVSSGLSFELDL